LLLSSSTFRLSQLVEHQQSKEDWQGQGKARAIVYTKKFIYIKDARPTVFKQPSAIGRRVGMGGGDGEKSELLVCVVN
jgi:hypothetical protein